MPRRPLPAVLDGLLSPPDRLPATRAASGAALLLQALAPQRATLGPEAGWVGAVLRRYHERDPDQRLISILQGWDVTETELAAQIAQSRAGGSAGYLVAGMEIDQSF